MRREDWQPRLWRELTAAEGKPFEYGKHDCVRLVARCLDVMLPHACYLALISELYHDKRSALRCFFKYGGLEKLVCDYIGPPVPRNLARVGDVCAVDLPTGPAIGICVGPRIAVAASPAGVLYLKLEQAICAWRV